VQVESAPTDLLWDRKTLLIVCADGKLVTESGDSFLPKEQIKVASAALTKKGTKNKTVIEALSDGSDEEDFDADSASKAAHSNGAKNKAKAPPKATAGRIKKRTAANENSDEEDFRGSGNESPKAKANRFVDDEAAEDNDDDSISPTHQIDTPSKNAARSNSIGESTSPKDDDTIDADDDFDTEAVNRAYDNNASHLRHEMLMQYPEPQPAFAPSSTPLDLPRRFLCWNHIGSVTLRHDDTGEGRSTVDINFTDSGFRRPIGFTDNNGFIIGSLGEDGGIFVTDLAEEDDEDAEDILESTLPGLSETTRQAVKNSRRRNGDPTKPTGSSIYFHRFESFASVRDKDWYITLPSGERALGTATGAGWAAVMTR
jgi:Minichromosome loss protein, Mcl1, middle region